MNAFLHSLLCQQSALRGTVKNLDPAKRANATVALLIPPYKDVNVQVNTRPLFPGVPVSAANAY